MFLTKRLIISYFFIAPSHLFSSIFNFLFHLRTNEVFKKEICRIKKKKEKNFIAVTISQKCIHISQGSVRGTKPVGDTYLT